MSKTAGKSDNTLRETQIAWEIAMDSCYPGIAVPTLNFGQQRSLAFIEARLLHAGYRPDEAFNLIVEEWPSIARKLSDYTPHAERPRLPSLARIARHWADVIEPFLQHRLQPFAAEEGERGGVAV